MTTMAELSQRIERLTVEHLCVVATTLRRRFQNEDTVVYGLAAEALRFFLGDDWTNQNIFRNHKHVSTSNRQGRSFFKTDLINDRDEFRHMQRVLQLAENLFGMQNVPAFKSRLALLAKNNLESAVGEMNCANLFSQPTLAFRFRAVTANKQADYDAEISTISGRTLCCEFKTKLEHHPYNPNSLANTLRKARTQLPADKPGLIGVSIPETWAINPNCFSNADAVVRHAFARSDRITAIALIWESWNRTDEGWAAANRRFRLYPNRNSSLYGADIDDLRTKLGHTSHDHWIDFRKSIRSASPITPPA